MRLGGAVREAVRSCGGELSPDKNSTDIVLIVNVLSRAKP